jgi:plasmid stability protein
MEAFQMIDDDDDGDRMVLRTVYLPPDLDEKLKLRAFQARRSKNDLIREAISSALEGGDTPTTSRGRSRSKQRS